MKSKRLAIGGIFSLTIAALCGCGGGGDPSSPPKGTEVTVPDTRDDANRPPTNPDIEAAAPIDADKTSRPARPKVAARAVKSVVLSEQEPVEQHFPDGSLKARWHLRLYVTFNRALPLYQQEAGSYEFHGPYEEYYPGGTQLFVKGNYVDGARDGRWTFWHPDGAKAKAGQYAGGKLEGQWHVWREDGTLLRTESYLDNEMHGAWTTYADDGETVVSREKFDHGEAIQE